LLYGSELKQSTTTTTKTSTGTFLSLCKVVKDLLYNVAQKKMKVQKGTSPEGKTVWMVLDSDYLPVTPIQKYFRYLDSLDRSPNTIKTYACNLKLYWEFLTNKNLDWTQVTLENLSEFIHWLKSPEPNVIHLQPQTARRSQKTINLIIKTVSFFSSIARLGS
jgi:hypothetical protein